MVDWAEVAAEWVKAVAGSAADWAVELARGSIIGIGVDRHGTAADKEQAGDGYRGNPSTEFAQWKPQLAIAGLFDF